MSDIRATKGLKRILTSILELYYLSSLCQPELPYTRLWSIQSYLNVLWTPQMDRKFYKFVMDINNNLTTELIIIINTSFIRKILKKEYNWKKKHCNVK